MSHKRTIKRVEKLITVTGGTIDAGQSIDQGAGVIYDAFVNTTGNVDVTLGDGAGRDCLNGAGAGITANKIITNNDLGGGLSVDSNELVPAGTAAGNFTLVLGMVS